MTGHDPAHMYLRVVPTADLSVALGMSVTILLLSLYYGIKVKGIGGWVRQADKSKIPSLFFLPRYSYYLFIT